MDLDIESVQGSPEKPAIIFIHGLGMDKNLWVAPFRSRVFGGMCPLEVLVSRYAAGDARRLRTLYHDLMGRDYPVITWSQQRVSNQIEAVIPELEAVVERAREMSDSGIMMIGHSRGGLIARKYLSVTDNSVMGLITIATPHKGSTLARLAQYIAPITSFLGPLVTKGDKYTIARDLKRITEFLKSQALRELLPDSVFFQTLRDAPLDGVLYISAGGTNPMLYSLSPFSFPGIFEKIIPEHLFPDEMKSGKGDGLVSAESSKLPWADEHFYFDCNHAEILFDTEARQILLNAIDHCLHERSR